MNENDKLKKKKHQKNSTYLDKNSYGQMNSYNQNLDSLQCFIPEKNIDDIVIQPNSDRLDCSQFASNKRLITEDLLLDDNYYRIRQKNRMEHEYDSDKNYDIDQNLNRFDVNDINQEDSLVKLKEKTPILISKKNQNLNQNGDPYYKVSIDFSNKNINLNNDYNANKEVIHKGYKSSSIIDNSIDNKSNLKKNIKSSFECSQDLNVEKKNKSHRHLINSLQNNTMVIDDEDIKFLIEYRKFLLEPEEENVTHHWYLKITLSEICLFILNLLTIFTSVSSRYMAYSKDYFDIEVDKFISNSTLYISSFLNILCSKILYKKLFCLFLKHITIIKCIFHPN